MTEQVINYEQYIERPAKISRHDQFKPPFRMILAGGSGCGKTNLLLNIITRYAFFENCYIFSKTIKDDAKYDIMREFLEMTKDKISQINSKNKPRIKAGVIPEITFNYTMTDNVNNLPNFETLNLDHESIFIFDDAVNEIRENKKFLDYVQRLFSYGRHKGISIIVCTQKLENAIPSFIRSNTTDFILFGRQTNNAFVALSSYTPYDYDQLKQLFATYIKKKHDFFHIKKDESDEKRLCLNLDSYVVVSS